VSGAEPLVSAIIPVYNGQAYLAEALESVLTQTYKPIECIVVDDGSTDATGDVVRHFGDQIRYVRRAHEGVAAARNAGASIAQGQFLAFLDADDLWEESKIERQMTLFADRPELGLVYCALERVDRRGRSLGALSVPNPDEALRNILLQRGPWPSIAQTGVIPVVVFAAAGRFDERLSTAADSDLAWRIAARFDIAAVHEPLSRYRSHDAQMHLDIAAYEHDVKILLSKAFASNLLPAELQRLERRARTNLALTLAYTYRVERRQPVRALRELLVAFRLSPGRCARGMRSVMVDGLRRRGAA
jgi:glycosyltransferase involved in cell wall biosynthesis